MSKLVCSDSFNSLFAPMSGNLADRVKPEAVYKMCGISSLSDCRLLSNLANMLLFCSILYYLLLALDAYLLINQTLYLLYIVGLYKQ